MNARLILMNVILVLGLTMGCSHGRVVFDEGKDQGTNEPNGVTVRALWVKRKTEKMDVMFEVKNGYSHAVAIKDSAFSIKYEGARAVPKDAEGIISLSPGETTTRLMIFLFHTEIPSSGYAHVKVDPIRLHAKDGTAEQLKDAPPLKFKLDILAY